MFSIKEMFILVGEEGAMWLQRTMGAMVLVMSLAGCAGLDVPQMPAASTSYLSMSDRPTPQSVSVPCTKAFFGAGFLGGVSIGVWIVSAHDDEWEG